MKSASFLRKRSERITLIVIKVIGLCSFFSMFVLGANFLWCLVAPFITLLLFAPFIYLIKHSHKKESVKFLKVEIPILIVEFPTIILISYVWDVGKMAIFGIGISSINSESGFVTTFLIILAVSTMINFIGSLFLWHLGFKPRLRYLRNMTNEAKS